MFQEEVEQLCNITISLLTELESEPVYVREYIEEECKKLKEEGWLEQEGDRHWMKTYERGKYIIKIAFVHGRKGEHITGADFALELKDRKVIFIQSKKVGSDGRIHFNRFQLQKLIELEGQICGRFPFYSGIDVDEWIEIVHRFYDIVGKHYRYNYSLLYTAPFFPSYYFPFCATFYHLIMTNQSQKEERFFHTSEISFVLAGKKSASEKEFLNHGLKPDEFRKMFWECKIGGPDIKEDIKKDVFSFYSLLTNRLIIWLDIEMK